MSARRNPGREKREMGQRITRKSDEEGGSGARQKKIGILSCNEGHERRR